MGSRKKICLERAERGRYRERCQCDVRPTTRCMAVEVSPMAQGSLAAQGVEAEVDEACALSTRLVLRRLTMQSRPANRL